MNEIRQAVIDYVNTPGTDYALLINGPWGCGKTYFWKHMIEPQLRNAQKANAAWRPLYVSLYGCKSVKEIDTQLFFASYPHLKSKWMTRLTTVGGNVLNQILKAFTRFELPAIDLRWLINTKQALLCFDDLERTSLGMKETLGYINTFVEHEQVKVFILCNEDAISDKEERDVFVKMKEKVVGASLAFRPELDSVLTTLVGEHKHRESFQAFLSANLANLRELFDRSETSNIRSLRRAIAALAVIYEFLKSNTIDVSALARPLIYAVAPTAFELQGRGATADELRKIHGYKYLSSISFVTALNRTRKSTQESDEDQYQRSFAERYLPDGTVIGDALGCLPICEFLLSGVLNRPALLEWARELTKQPDEQEERVKRLMTAPWELEDEEFAGVVTQVLKEVEAGEVSAIGTYLGLFNTFEQLVSLSLVRLNLAELLAKFSEGLRKAEESETLVPSQDLVHAIGHPSFAPNSEEGRTFREEVKKANERLLRRSFSERVRAIISRFKQEPLAFVKAISEGGEIGLRYAPVFDQLDSKDTTEWIIGLPNEIKRRLLEALRKRYENGFSTDLYAVELANLTLIRKTLKEHREVSLGAEDAISISLLLVGEIVRTLDGVISHLGQQDAPADASVAAANGNEAAVVEDGSAEREAVTHAPQ